MTKITFDGKEVHITSSKKEDDFAIDILAIFSTLYEGTYFQDKCNAMAVKMSMKDIMRDIDKGKSYLGTEYSIDMQELWKQLGELE